HQRLSEEVSTEMTSWQSSDRTPKATVRDGSPDAADDAGDCFDPKGAAAPPPLCEVALMGRNQARYPGDSPYGPFLRWSAAHGHLAQPSPPAARGEGFGRTRAAAQVARSAGRDLGRGRPGTVSPRPRLAGCRNH